MFNKLNNILTERTFELNFILVEMNGKKIDLIIIAQLKILGSICWANQKEKRWAFLHFSRSSKILVG